MTPLFPPPRSNNDPDPEQTLQGGTLLETPGCWANFPDVEQTLSPRLSTDSRVFTRHGRRYVTEITRSLSSQMCLSTLCGTRSTICDRFAKNVTTNRHNQCSQKRIMQIGKSPHYKP